MTWQIKNGFKEQFGDKWASRRSAEFLPDTIPYTMSEDDYKATWNEINDPSKGKYFYTEGYEVKRVGFFKALKEFFRGMIGKENRCTGTRTKMALYKLAYYGYAKGYDKSVLDSAPTWKRRRYRLNQNLLNKLKNPRSDAASGELQKELITFYRRHYLRLIPNFWTRVKIPKDDNKNYKKPKNKDYSFGETSKYEDNLALTAVLDPQDDEVLDDMAKKIISQHVFTNSIILFVVD